MGEEHVILNIKKTAKLVTPPVFSSKRETTSFISLFPKIGA